MYKEIYIDLVFVTNLLLDYFLLRLLSFLFRSSGTVETLFDMRVFHYKTGRGSCFAAAFLGALFSCLVIVMMGEKSWITYLLHGVCAIVMIRVGCGLKKYRLLVKGMITLYLTAFLWGGFWEVVLNEKSITQKTFFLFAAGTYLGLLAMLRLSENLKTKWKNTYRITLFYKGKVHTAYGYYDTGNLLTDPFVNVPVSIIGSTMMERILSKETTRHLEHFYENFGEKENTKIAELHPRMVPYRTVGKENGMLLAVTLEELCIHTPKEVVHIKSPVFGISWEPSALGKEYEVLLNSKLLSREGNGL